MDFDLVRSAQRGDREAFMELVRARVDRLFRVAYRTLRDVDRAEDALQDSLVIAWRNLRGLRDPDRFDAWLVKVVMRECVKQAVRERHRIANLQALPLDGPAGPEAYQSLIQRDQLERGFRRLPPEQRAILVLHHYEGYALSDIATALGIPPGTARSRLHHAHRAMRAALDADERTPRQEGRSA